MQFHVGGLVKVKLTTYGKYIYFHMNDGLVGIVNGVKQEMPPVDSEGFTTFELWYFMRVFGPHLVKGGESVICDNLIYFLED